MLIFAGIFILFATLDGAVPAEHLPAMGNGLLYLPFLYLLDKAHG
ncbi:hypothetical protein [Cohnella thermotolerans]|nr:hypothetical protein [Cohnella thermotolerans]